MLPTPSEFLVTLCLVDMDISWNCILLLVGLEYFDDSISLLFILNKALEKAKEAGRKERALCRQREQTSLGEQVNLDMTYSVSTFSCYNTFFLKFKQCYVNSA